MRQKMEDVEMGQSSVPALLAQKFNPSSFVRNIQLCGYNPSIPCLSTAPSQGILAPPPEVSKQHHHRKLSTRDIILIVAGALLLRLITLCCILFFCLMRKRASMVENGRATSRTAAMRIEKGVPPVAAGDVEAGGEGGGKLVHFDGPMAFTADDLLCATAEIMGKSTYGTMYKATLEDGSQVAVKRLREKITKSQREFEPEVSVLGKFRHPNLLALRAFYLGPKADDLLCATTEIMGKSTYGTVSKATLEDGSQVAVKRLREKITKSQREFESDVSVLGKIRHPNLLALRACYLGPKGGKLLVFYYMPKGILASFLHGKSRWLKCMFGSTFRPK
ncbi:hypothetical protein RJT34_04202 [Clitoria ternatea]|uniref:Protein kinase domain-containing protein n=1 Tax=Clitoria ternatea TaxID=43366 RepID=A0AAN9KN21_CLITE